MMDAWPPLNQPCIRQMKSDYKMKRVLPPGRQYVFFKITGPVDTYHVVSSDMPKEKVSKQVIILSLCSLGFARMSVKNQPEDGARHVYTI